MTAEDESTTLQTSETANLPTHRNILQDPAVVILSCGYRVKQRK